MTIINALLIGLGLFFIADWIAKMTKLPPKVSLLIGTVLIVVVIILNIVIPQGISDEDINDIAERTCEILDDRRTDFDRKYPVGYTGFGVHGSKIIVPKGCIPKGFDIKWDTAKVLEQTTDTIKILLPDMTINTATLRNGWFSKNTITIKKIIGAIQSGGYILGGIGFQLEVIGFDKDKDMFVVGLGFMKMG